MQMMFLCIIIYPPPLVKFRQKKEMIFLLEIKIFTKRNGENGFHTHTEINIFEFLEGFYYMLQKKYIFILTVFLLGACSDNRDRVSAADTTVQRTVSGDVKIGAWGPQAIKLGQGFNQQANGNSAFWFEQRGIFGPNDVEVWIDKSRLDNLIIKPDMMGTVEVSPELIKKPGKYLVYLVILSDGKKINIGEFEVQ